jgi:hypothetical protein
VADGASDSETPVPPFEFATNFNALALGGGGRTLACVGGGGSGTFNLNNVLGIEADVSGCKLLGLAPGFTGDALIFAVGPRLTWRSPSHWTPWLNVLVGGEKLTEEYLSQSLKVQTLASAPPNADPSVLHAKYTTDYSATGFRLSVGGGVDYDLNRAVAFRISGFEYAHTWAGALKDTAYPDSLRLTTGIVLRMGN